MATKKRGLGLGSLDVLLSDTVKSAVSTQPAQNTAPENTIQKDGLRYLPIEFMQPGKYQPRQHIASESLQELADSIRAQGVIQPIVVRPLNHGADTYEIIAGERRWRAAQQANLDKVPVVIRQLADEAAMAMALIENIQREDLNAVEEALALERLATEFGLTHQEIASTVGKSRTAVTNLLRILNLNNDVRLMLEQGKLELGHAKVLLALEGDEQSHMARKVVLKGLTVRETENLLKQENQSNGQISKRSFVDPNIRSLENDLAERLGAKVNFQHKENGKGKLVIHYNSLDELDGILSHINQ